jgi:hypothetical protein
VSDKNQRPQIGAQQVSKLMIATLAKASLALGTIAKEKSVIATWTRNTRDSATSPGS